MKNEVLNKEFKPSGKGWETLSAKLDQVDSHDKQDIFILKALSVVFVIFLSFQFKPKTEDLWIEQWQNYEASPQMMLVNSQELKALPGTPHGIKLYWLFMEEAQASEEALELKDEEFMSQNQP